MSEFGVLPAVPAAVLSEPLVWLVVAVALVGALFILLPLALFAQKVGKLARWVARSGHSTDEEALFNKLDPVAPEFQEEWRANAIDLPDGISSSARLREHLDLSLAYGQTSGVRVRLIQPYAGVLLALGILFTFSGLISGLQGLQTGDATALTNGINVLLSGIFVAFGTSIAGIFLSILWILGSRALLGWTDRNIQRLDNAVHAILPWISPYEVQTERMAKAARESHAVLLRQLEQQQDQTGILQTLGVDIAEAFAGKLRESLNADVMPVLSELNASLGEFLTLQMEAQQSSMGEMVAAFQSGLTSHLQSHVGEISGVMQQASDNIERFHETLAQTLLQLESMTDSQNLLLQRTSVVSADLAGSIEGLKQVHGSISSAVDDYAGAAAEARAITEIHQGVREELSDHLRNVSKHVKSLDSAAERLEASLGTMVPKLESAVTEFTGMSADKLAEVFHVFDREVAKVVDHLSGTLSQINEMLEESTPATEALNATLVDLKDIVDGTRLEVVNLSSTLLSGRESQMEIRNSLAKVATALTSNMQSNGMQGDDGASVDGRPRS